MSDAVISDRVPQHVLTRQHPALSIRPAKVADPSGLLPCHAGVRMPTSIKSVSQDPRIVSGQ